MNTNLVRLLTSFIFLSTATLSMAQDATATLSVNGKAVLALKVPPDAKVTLSNGYANIHTSNMSLHVWAVPKAKTVAKALPRTADIIKGEFIKYAITSTEDITIAGAPAKHVIGAGNEADDGDPGHAEVVLFKVGKHVFAACVHGEFDDASRARAPMMAMLQTARAP